ncbi:MAG: hypothetical protein KIG65_02380 [Eubacteriales bacterium]|nr:hypothetical protein [Eubacteriales bacterium]
MSKRASSYDKGTSADRVMRDIDNYFKGGTQSELMRFHAAEGDEVLYGEKYSYDFIESTTKSLEIMHMFKGKCLMLLLQKTFLPMQKIENEKTSTRIPVWS